MSSQIITLNETMISFSLINWATDILTWMNKITTFRTLLTSFCKYKVRHLRQKFQSKITVWIHSYSLGNILGNGSFGRVVLSIDNSTGCIMAAK